MAAVIDMQELHQLLTLAHAPGPQMGQAAERLFQNEVRPGFGMALVQLLQNEGCDTGVRQAASIYLKNFLKRRWGVEQGGVSASEREALRDLLLPLAVRAPRPVRAHVVAAIQDIAAVDFPEEWPKLLPALTQHLAAAAGDAYAQTGVFQAAHAVFIRFKSTQKGGDPVREARSCAEAFGPAHLQAWTAACERVLHGMLSEEQLVPYWELLRGAVACFHDFHQMVLPNFFCENREPYLEGFIALLGRRSGSLATGGHGPLEALQVEICAVLTLYANRYEEQFGAYVGRVTKSIWDMLTALGQREEYDQLAAAGISYLTAAAVTEWKPSPFEDPAALQAICEHIILPNIRLRPSDAELFWDEPQEYITKDVEGGDEETRRRSAMDLVRSLRRFYNAKICEVLVSYAGTLLEQSQALEEEQAILCKDACLHLVIAMAASAQTQGGLNAGIVEQFFTSQVVPELQAEQMPKRRELLRASCLKYVTVLRTVLPTHCVVGIMPVVAKHILAENPVVHTYAAVCANLVASVKDPVGKVGQRANRYDPQLLRPHLVPMVLPMLHILGGSRGIPQNEFLARALVSIFTYLEAESMEVAPQALQLLVEVISVVLAPNPRNAECIHATFECCAVLLKLLVPAGASQVEGVLLPVLGRVWEQGTEELLPYCFQLLALLVDLAPAPSPSGGYAELLSRVVREELWQTAGNVPGLVRLLRAYFAKHHIFGGLIRSHMQAIFERFHFVLGHRVLGTCAFGLLNAMLRYLPPDFYHQYFQTAVALALARTQGKKSPEIEKELVISLSLFTFVTGDAEAVPRILEQIQPNIFPRFMTQVWLPGATKVLLLQRRKICVVGLAKLMTCAEIRSNPQLLQACCDCLAGLLRWKNAGLMCWLSTVLIPKLMGDEDHEVHQYSPSYSRLTHGEPGSPHSGSPGTGTVGMGSIGWDILPEIQDRATGLAVVREALAPVRQAIESLEKVPPVMAEIWQ